MATGCTRTNLELTQGNFESQVYIFLFMNNVASYKHARKARPCKSPNLLAKVMLTGQQFLKTLTSS